MNRKGYALVCERSQSGLGDDVLAVFQDFARESSQEKSERLFLSLFVRKGNYDHVCVLSGDDQLYQRGQLENKSMTVQSWAMARRRPRPDATSPTWPLCPKDCSAVEPAEVAEDDDGHGEKDARKLDLRTPRKPLPRIVRLSILERAGFSAEESGLAAL